jgi:hypothetical protein
MTAAEGDGSPLDVNAVFCPKLNSHGLWGTVTIVALFQPADDAGQEGRLFGV